MEQQVPITTPPHFPSRGCCTGCRQQCRLCHVLEIFRDTQSPSFVTQHRLCLRCCSALAGADSCTRHWQSFGASRPDPQLLSRGCICPRAQLQLIYLSLKLPKLNCICQKAFSACRSPAVFGNPMLTLGVCVDWEVWRVNRRFTCKPVFSGSGALFPGGNWVWWRCQRLSQQAVPDLQVMFLCPVTKYKVIQDSLTPQWGRTASTGTQPTDGELKSSCWKAPTVLSLWKFHHIAITSTRL